MDKKIRVLVAEEDSGFLKMVEDSLKASGSLYDVEKISSGKECLEKLQKEKFDILLLDHSLPDGEGLNWLRRFNDQGIGIPTIFVTAKGDPRLAIEAMKEGVFDYINRSAECAKAFPFVVNRAIEGHGLMLEKVRLQRELIETKNFLESIVEKAGDAISVVDLEGKILYWNEGAEKIYGYKKEEVLGQKISQFLYPRDDQSRTDEEKAMGDWITQVKEGKVIPNVEVKRQTKEGKEIIINMTISPLRNAEGKVIGASRICKEITHLKKAEERLILAERLSSLGELTAGVAHELRNPLAGIKINTQILSRKKDFPEMEKKLLHSTQEGIEKIQKIVDDMLHFAKPKAAHFKEEDINEVVAESLAILKTKLKKANITSVFGGAQALPRLRIDIHQVQQVFINLILNAIEAMNLVPTGPRSVTISSAKSDLNGVLISVQDSGVGFTKENRDRLFDAFYTTKPGGMGMGLAISRSIVESHCGRIWAAPNSPRGAIFQFTLPTGRGLNA